MARGTHRQELGASLWLALYAGLSSVFVTLLYQAIKSFVALPTLAKWRTAETTALVSFGILVIIEPLLSRIRIAPVESPIPKKREKVLVMVLSLLVIALVSVSHSLLHEYLGETIRQRGSNAIEQLAFSLAAPSLITLGWLYGLRKEPRKSGIYGLFAAILVGMLWFTVATLFLRNYVYTTMQTTGLTQFQVVEVAALEILLFFSWMITGAVPSGYFGGLALDSGWCRHAWQGTAMGLAVGATITPIAVGITFKLLSVYSGKKLSSLFAWSYVLEPMIGNIGWALGFALVPEADSILRGNRTKPNREFTLIRESAQVMLIAGLMIASLTAFSFFCMAIPNRFILMAGSQAAARPSPSAKAVGR